jgi:hypothetical protein
LKDFRNASVLLKDTLSEPETTVELDATVCSEMISL